MKCKRTSWYANPSLSSYFLAPKDIYPYDTGKQKYAVKKTRPVFLKGLDEIENNPDVLLYGTVS